MDTMKSSARRGLRVLLLTLVGLVGAFVVLVRVSFDGPGKGEEVSLDRVYGFADQGAIVEAALLDEDALVVGTRRTGCPDAVAPAAEPADPAATTTVPA
ncbi:MAG: hypothetical protein ACRD0N_02395, partial [Acidimicrobiales bacterium]